jgi:hypothetical protein
LNLIAIISPSHTSGVVEYRFSPAIPTIHFLRLIEDTLRSEVIENQTEILSNVNTILGWHLKNSRSDKNWFKFLNNLETDMIVVCCLLVMIIQKHIPPQIPERLEALGWVKQMAEVMKKMKSTEGSRLIKDIDALPIVRSGIKRKSETDQDGSGHLPKLTNSIDTDEPFPAFARKQSAEYLQTPDHSSDDLGLQQYDTTTSEAPWTELPHPVSSGVAATDGQQSETQLAAGFLNHSFEDLEESYSRTLDETIALIDWDLLDRSGQSSHDSGNFF